MDTRHPEAQALLRDLLGDDRLTISLDSFLIEEGPGEPPSRLMAQVRFSDTQDLQTLEGTGVGSFHAFFTALCDRLSRSYSSLREVAFLGMKVRSIPGSDRSHPMDAEAEVSLRIRNGEGRETEFVTHSRSLIRAALAGITDALEYYANTERAYERLSRQIRDAKAANEPRRLRDLEVLRDRLVSLTAYPVPETR